MKNLFRFYLPTTSPKESQSGERKALHKVQSGQRSEQAKYVKTPEKMDLFRKKVHVASVEREVSLATCIKKERQPH